MDKREIVSGKRTMRLMSWTIESSVLGKRTMHLVLASERSTREVHHVSRSWTSERLPRPSAPLRLMSWAIESSVLDKRTMRLVLSTREIASGKCTMRLVLSNARSPRESAPSVLDKGDIVSVLDKRTSPRAGKRTRRLGRAHKAVWHYLCISSRRDQL